MSEDFICAGCKGEFTKMVSDEVAREEAKQEFGAMSDAGGEVILCDDCYKEFMAGLQAPADPRLASHGQGVRVPGTPQPP